MARFVLITGKIGSGKSAVSELLRKKHYIVVDTDKEVKKLYTEDAEMFQSVLEQFGRASLNEDGSINKAYLAEAMLSKDPEMQEKVRLLEEYARKEGIPFTITSGYRSREEQIALQNKYAGQRLPHTASKIALSVPAMPGRSGSVVPAYWQGALFWQGPP